MPRVHLSVGSQQEADSIKTKIPGFVKLIARPPNTIECLIEVDSKCDKCAKKTATLYLHDREERRTDEFRDRVIAGMKSLFLAGEANIVFIKEENWIEKSKVEELCNNCQGIRKGIRK